MLAATGRACCSARTSVFWDLVFATWLALALSTGCLDLPMAGGTIALVTLPPDNRLPDPHGLSQ